MMRAIRNIIRALPMTTNVLLQIRLIQHDKEGH